MNSNPWDGSGKLGHDTLMMFILVFSEQSSLKCKNSHHIITFFLFKTVFLLCYVDLKIKSVNLTFQIMTLVCSTNKIRNLAIRGKLS